MLKDLKVILEIQELDMKMIRLMRLKKDRQNELDHIEALREDLKDKKDTKNKEIEALEKEIKLLENSSIEIKAQLKKLEAKQSSIKKVEEFNALTKEMSTKERERLTTEKKASDLIDKKNIEEEAGIFKNLRDKLGIKDYFVLEQTFPNGNKNYLYVDFKTHLVYIILDQMGPKVEWAMVFYDYKEVDGVMFAYSMSWAFGRTQAQATLTFTDVIFNSGLEDSLFKMSK